MTVAVGIMQGRLLPPFEGRFQTFPAEGWRDEFPRAQAAGLHCIEWIYEVPHEADNPLGSDAGVAEMAALIERTGVRVRSICADYYMQRRLIGADGRADKAVAEHLDWLIGRAALLGITYMVLPFVDASSLKTEDERAELATMLARLLPRAQAAGVELHLETDLPPDAFSALLSRVGHPFLKANYDIGNSASLGYDPNQELVALKPFLGSVHVKDRVRGGGTVPLGTGNADFSSAFRRIREAGFDRWFILQAARNPDMDEVAWAAHNRAFVERWVG
ncbi:MAG TPA: sugar phosphate isomerase/epimerase family protein [Candidatus Omnitrophota bacterium]|nr:sugar phosphate isomerase/epimerase family protein [Candidatus Omnitrophota bacterium]